MTADISRKHLNSPASPTASSRCDRRQANDPSADGRRTPGPHSGCPLPTPDIAGVGAPGDSRSQDRLVRRFGDEAAILQEMIDREPARWAPDWFPPRHAVSRSRARCRRCADAEEAADTRLRVTWWTSSARQALAGVRRVGAKLSSRTAFPPVMTPCTPAAWLAQITLPHLGTSTGRPRWSSKFV